MILLAAVPCVAVAEPRHDLVAGALEKAAIFIVIARAARPWTVAIGRIAARRGIAELARPQRAWAFAAPAARFADRVVITRTAVVARSEEHTSELQSLMRISYSVFFLINKFLLSFFF